MPDTQEPRAVAWTDSEKAVLQDYREQRDSSEAAVRAQAELHAEIQQRAAERRLQEVHVQTLIAQVADLTVANHHNERRMREAERKLEEVKRGLQENTDITTEVRDLLAAFKGGFRVLGWLGVGAKWGGALAAAAVSVYTLGYMITHGGQPPGK